MKIRWIALCLCLLVLLTGCKKNKDENDPLGSETPGEAGDLGDADTSFGSSLDDLGAYEGYFDEELADVTVTCISGTQGAYRIDGNTLTFTSVDADSVYSISGKFAGNIVIDTGDDHKFDLELHGFSLVCRNTNPIVALSGDEITIKAKKDTNNYIYDTRAAIDPTDEALLSGAIHAEVDLEISGKGTLTLVSEHNNGIHSKDDLQVKNLTLLVSCVDNALKGNDSVEITGGSTTLIASGGDGIKTSNSDISSKGNQRGTVSITGGTHSIYAACDGIDAAYDVNIDDGTTVLNIYTDKYSNYSSEVAASSADANYIRFTSNAYYYSVKYYNSDTDFAFVNAEYHSKVSSGMSNYYYYSYPKMPSYSKQQFFIYESSSQRGQEEEYLVKTDYLTPNGSCDTFALKSRGNQLTYSWTNYTTTIEDDNRPGGGGGMQDGNTDKGDHSTKGIKAANEIVILGGTVNIKAYDDAIHANNDAALENGAAALGNVTINGGNITVYSNDDGLHADGTLSVTAGTVSVTNSYEGLEGNCVKISGGYVSVNAMDDGINGVATSGTAIEISGGEIYIYCTGDGIDSNSRTSYSGIAFSGGRTVIIANSRGNSAIDTEQGYAYTGGLVIACMPSGGMTSEATHCRNFSSIGKSSKMTLTSGEYLVAKLGDTTATVKIPVTLSAFLIVLGDKSPSIKTESSTGQALDKNGVAWS